mgnify:CR=1 FL=1
MKNIIKCVNEDCNHEEPVRGDEWMYKTTLGIKRAVRGQGQTVLCSICDCQTILIDDKW